MDPKLVLFPYDPEVFLQQIREIIRSEMSMKEKEPVYNQPKEDSTNIAGAAQVTGYKKGYLYELIRKRAIPYLKLDSGAIRFSRKELENWLKAGRPNIHQEAINNLATNFLVNGKN